ncbi:ribonuclease E inhibitor RraB [Aeromonas salmonicida]|uniref:ribonuclease E inhibitor RraB n=1 Tax=Aeromonas salmonicida TaxID=645 RepID=UPI000F769E5B|nr:ribonuclease E inhibitor RraB [Aeromonas salmonicida]RSM22891.1 ribonuclease E inhibitor RraB [Aeromonas salmonicida]
MSLDMQEWRAETTAIVNELLADGSNPDLEYDIEHHFACQDFDLLEKAAVDLFKAGFEVTDAEEMELDDGAPIFCFDATIERKLDIETIVADIEKMLPILKKYGVDYDGWGTYFQGNPPEKPGCS